METERLARGGETFVCDRLYTSGGGKGGNQAVAAARFAGTAGRVNMIGRMGDDAFGGELRTFMSEQGIDMSAVAADADVETGVAIIFVDRTGENFVHAVYGGNGMCGEVEAAAAIAELPNAGVLLVQQEIPLECSLAAMRAARRADVPVILDPAPSKLADEVPSGFYEAVDIVTPNAWETEELSGIAVTEVASATEAAKEIQRRHGIKHVVVTLAGDGVVVARGGDVAHVPAYEVDAVATVAAGDAFAGVLGQAICEGAEFDRALRLAMAAGAICVSREGTQTAMPQRAEVIALADG